jgi:hypothetical protein
MLLGAMHHHTICVTGDAGLRLVLRRCGQAAGSQVEFVERCEQLRARDPLSADLLVIDEPALSREVVGGLLGHVRRGASVVLLGDPLECESALDLLRHEGCDHFIGRGTEVDGDELLVTALKVLHGDIFGIEKYLSPGVAVREREVLSYEEKRVAIREVVGEARRAGCRRHMIARVECVTDELLMNAIYDAPASGSRSRTRRSRPAQELSRDLRESARLRYSFDARHFAVSVRDRFGELRKSCILDNLARARRGRCPVRTDAADGGGLGLYLILNSVSRFIANIHPGNATEVICLFDLHVGAREFYERAKSVNIFVNPTR